ncbi:CDP-alcohol phosphatidyltransferase family protein [bacterium]|nr:CDP-alcohol phosphatidyltransferase family protein [bacterium]
MNKKEIFIKGKPRSERFLKWPRKSWVVFKDSPILRASLIKTMFVCVVILIIVSTSILVWIDKGLGKSLLVWTAPSIFLYTLIVLSNLRFICDNNGKRKKHFQASNILTSVRIISVVPMLVLLFKGYLCAALVVYFLAALTDVIDGYVARRYSQETRMGLMLDPTGDILSTESVFFFLWMRADFPLWLLILLTVRYFQFFAGLALLYLFNRRPILQATITGKIVGIIQFLGAAILVYQKIVPEFVLGEIAKDSLLLVLGLSFMAVIVSQTSIGINAVRVKRESSVISGGY